MIRRSWWFNLADIALRLNDETQRQAAIRAALAVSTSPQRRDHRGDAASIQRVGRPAAARAIRHRPRPIERNRGRDRDGEVHRSRLFPESQDFTDTFEFLQPK